MAASFFTYCLLITFSAYMTLGSRANTVRHASALKTDDRYEELRSEILESIETGLEIALQQCQEDFMWDRWNCTKVAFSRRFMSPSNREMAYVAAITAAGIAYSVARACSSGMLGPECKCPRSERAGNCVRDLEAGQRVALQFLDSLEHGAQDVTAKVNRHNYYLGVKTLELESSADCKCHGMSGSCTTRTCFGRVASFPRVGKRLKASFIRALRVNANRNSNFSELYSDQMLFLDDSPDYCKPNPALGYYGTQGRPCTRKSGKSASKAERRSCRELCRSCGHQVRHRTVLNETRCNCEFVWCCSVKCGVCITEESHFFCDSH